MKKSLLAFFLVLAAYPAFSDVYDCTATQKAGRGGWVPDRIILEILRDGEAARALDGAIQSVHGGPIDVDIQAKSANDFQLKWKVRGIKTTTGSTILTQTVRLDTKKLSFRIQPKVHGADNNVSGSGTCKRVPGGTLGS